VVIADHSAAYVMKKGGRGTTPGRAALFVRSQDRNGKKEKVRRV